MSFINSFYTRNQKHKRNSSRGPYADSVGRRHTSNPASPSPASRARPSAADDDDKKPAAAARSQSYSHSPAPADGDDTPKDAKRRSRLSSWFHRHASDDGRSRSKRTSMSNNVGSVGAPNIYAAGDQRNEPSGPTGDRFHDGKANSHVANDSKDERTIANKLAREEKRKGEADAIDPEAAISQKDSTMPAKMHGNEPSKGAKIDQELKEEEAAILAKKDAKK